MTDKEVNIVAVAKGQERYVFLYTDEYRAQVLNTFGRFASDPELSFTSYDAAMAAQCVREMKPS